jgi:hypothetical protein
MQRDYRYERVEPTGRNFHPEFKPDLTPADILRLGVFGGKYMTDCGDEFPPSWFEHAKLASGPRDKSLNYFGVDASQPLSEWRRKGWIHPDDPRGWFQWYCRSWGDECRTRTLARSNAGRQSAVMCVSCSLRASLAMSGAAGGNGRRCCTGHMTVVSCENFFPFCTIRGQIGRCRGNGASPVLQPRADRDQRVAELAGLHLAISSRRTARGLVGKREPVLKIS